MKVRQMQNYEDQAREKDSWDKPVLQSVSITNTKDNTNITPGQNFVTPTLAS